MKLGVCFVQFEKKRNWWLSLWLVILFPNCQISLLFLIIHTVVLMPLSQVKTMLKGEQLVRWGNMPEKNIGITKYHLFYQTSDKVRDCV